MIRLLFLTISAGLTLATLRAVEPDFLPISSGALGTVTAKDGDSMFNAVYYADAESGAPLFSRLESAVGVGPTIPALASGYLARWSGTITPKRSARFPLSLRATGNATLSIDGKTVLAIAAAGADFTARRIAQVEMLQGKPYEFVVEFRNADGRGRVALDWATPAPRASTPPAAIGGTDADTEIGPAAGTAIGAPSALENKTYRVGLRADGTVLVTQKRTGAEAIFSPVFSVVFQTAGRRAKLAAKGAKYEDPGPVGSTNYLVPVWDKEADFLAAAHPRTQLRAERAGASGDKFTWRFAAQPAYEFAADLDLPADGTEPRLTWHFRAKAAGEVSIGYVGAPSVPLPQTPWLWQPLIWQERRFPNRSYLTLEYECPIPFTLVGLGENAVGVGADPGEMPYRMPTYENSRFGVLVRDAGAAARPQLFAPVLGGVDSNIAPGETRTFAVRLFVGAGGWFEAYKALAQTLYQFHDYRENTACNLNTTIENLTDFVLNDQFCYWFPRYKTWGYQNDGGAGAGRQQSAADGVSLALVLDRADLLERRARPTLEYFLSRNTVSTNFAQPGFMGGHVNNASDLVAAFRLTGRRTTAIRELFAAGAEGAEGADTGKRAPAGNRNRVYADRNELTIELTAYRLTGDRESLARASAAADRYIAARIAKPAADFHDLGSSFWTEMAPAYDLLYELYEQTGERRYLDAAAAAMRQFTAYEYLVPVIPNTEFVANPGGHYNRQPVPEEIVPAWQVSANGLAAECAGTAHSHRGVFMASYAAWMARLARDVHEPFFRDIARSAVVGRYANYPSYAYRNGYTTMHQKADFPLRPFEEIKKFTSAHYNHPLPMLAFTVDYLVSDIYARSDARVTFPSEYTNTGAYFRNKLYGAAPGRFYEDAGVYLWLPPRLVAVDSVQVNYVAARGNGRLYLALSNQSPRPVAATLTIDARRVALPGRHRTRVWRDNLPATDVTVTDGSVSVALSPKGLTCLAIDDATPRTEVQEAMLASDVPALPTGSSRTVATDFGPVTATALRFGRELTSVHVWLQAGPDRVQRAALTYTVDGVGARAEAAQFPYEFTIPVSDASHRFTCQVEAVTSGGRKISGPLEIPLRR